MNKALRKSPGFLRITFSDKKREWPSFLPSILESRLKVRTKLRLTHTAINYEASLSHSSVRCLGCDVSKRIANPGPRGIDRGEKDGAGNGIRTRDFNLGKVALYH